jgi:hypothetical protein
MAAFLAAHVQSATTLPDFGDRINPEEDIILCRVEGWHDE